MTRPSTIGTTMLTRPIGDVPLTGWRCGRWLDRLGLGRRARTGWTVEWAGARATDGRRGSPRVGERDRLDRQLGGSTAKEVAGAHDGGGATARPVADPGAVAGVEIDHRDRPVRRDLEDGVIGRHRRVVDRDRGPVADLGRRPADVMPSRCERPPTSGVEPADGSDDRHRLSVDAAAHGRVGVIAARRPERRPRHDAGAVEPLACRDDLAVDGEARAIRN